MENFWKKMAYIMLPVVNNVCMSFTCIKRNISLTRMFFRGLVNKKITYSFILLFAFHKHQSFFPNKTMSDIITLPGLVCTAIPHLQTLAHLILIYTSNIWKWLISTLYKSIVHISYVIMVIYLANHIPMNILKY